MAMLNTAAPANKGLESGEEFASRAQQAKRRNDAAEYIRCSIEAASAGIREMNEGKEDFATVATWLAEIIPLPSNPMAFIEPLDGWFMQSERFIERLSDLPLAQGKSTIEQFAAGRRLLAEACIVYYGDLCKAAKVETVQAVKAEAEAAKKAYLALPKNILALPENFERPFPIATTKSPELRGAFQRLATVERAVAYTERGYQFAAQEAGKAPTRLATLFHKLYAEPPADLDELNQLLLKHGLEKSPLAEAIKKK